MVAVSAVVPTLNEAGTIGAQVSWLLGLGVLEVLVVDGASADDTAAIATGAGARVIVAPRGRGHQLRVGAEAAVGDVVWFVHADVRPPADSLRHIDACIRRPGVVAGAFRLRTVPGHRRWWSPALRIADVRSRVARLPYGDQAVFVRKEALARIGGVPAQALFEDIELARRLGRVGGIRLVGAEVRASGRRFERAPIAAMLAMNLLPTLYRLGVSTDFLARWYGSPR